MILICDSGSTKADWILGVTDKVVLDFSSIGFNPFFHDADMIEKELLKMEEVHPIRNEVQSIYFFGAGCSSKERCEIVKDGLKRVFPLAYIEVDHDVLASAIATCGTEKGISCILGTGSNSCWFNGKDVLPNNYGLGYILGDEASGSYFGKLLLTHYLYGILPEDLTKEFNSVYGQMGKDFVIQQVYKMPGANVWLSSFARFLTDRKEHPWVKLQVRKGFDQFLDLFVCSYPEYKDVSVHFIGSIAYFFREILAEATAAKNIKTGKIIRKPIHDLAAHYLNQYA
jgi:N-acetylglucosamine kinase-like BadF-type ATPase